ncbi:MAG: hypothetical protein WAX77_10615 [Methylococcaceae bacterium]
MGLANALDNIISHDKITRFLTNAELTNKELWQLIKPTLRKYENEKGVIIFDDTIIHKPYSEENDLIAWHFDHTQNKTVKGMNRLNCIYHHNDKTIPLAFILIKKTKHYLDKEGKEKRVVLQKSRNVQRHGCRNPETMDGSCYKYIAVTGFQHPCWNDIVVFILLF